MNRSAHVGSAVVPEGFNGGARVVQLVVVEGRLREVWEHGSFRAVGVDPDCRFASVGEALDAVRASGRYLEVMAA